MRSRQAFPFVTVAFLVIVAVMFAIQRYLGTDSLPVLVRLGALQPELLAAGEYWRLLTAGVLHGGYSHAGFTAFVLLALGANLERLIGPARFALLLLVSIAGGFITSAWLLQSTLTVGASGGLWGLLGAYAVLAFSPLARIPADMKAPLRKATIINLGINAAVSFLPYVDWAAHLGGFVFGGLLFLVVLRHGLPDFDRVDEHGRLQPQPTGLALRAAAAASCLAFFVSLGIVFIHDRPFAFDAGYTPGSSYIPRLQATVTVPAQLEPVAGDTDLVLGNLLKQPGVCTIRRAALAGVVSDTALKSVSEKHAAQLKGVPDNAAPVGQVRTQTRNGHTVTSATYRYGTGLRMQRAFVTTRHADFFIECLTWPQFAAYADAAARIAGSIESRPRPAPQALERAQLDAVALPELTKEPVQIGARPWAPGLRVFQRSQTQSLMNMLAEPGKQADDDPVQVASVQRTRFSEREEQVLAMDGELPARVAIRFGRAGQVVEATGRPRAVSTEAFAGKTFVITRDGDAVQVSTEQGEPVDTTLAVQVQRASLLLRGQDPLEQLLAGRELTPGQQLQLTPQQAAQYADAHSANIAIQIALTYAGTYMRNDVRLAGFMVVWRQQQSSDEGFATELELRGLIGVGVDDGYTRDSRLAGEADLSGAQVFGLGTVRILTESRRSG